jgi:hypothetical protein
MKPQCTGDAARVQDIKAEIDRLAVELWGLMEEELREIMAEFMDRQGVKKT